MALETGLVVGRPQIRDEFEASFISWSNAVIQYSLKTQVCSTALQLVTAEFEEESSTPGTGVYTTWIGMSTFVIHFVFLSIRSNSSNCTSLLSTPFGAN